MTHERWDGIVESTRWEPTWPEAPDPGLAIRSARDHALRRLFDYLAEVEWRYAGRKDGASESFRIKRTSMFPEQPSNEVDFDFPAIGVLPAKHTFDEPWLGPPITVEESYGVYGTDTCLVHCGELSEELTLDVWCQFAAQRRSIIAGMESSVFHTERGPLYLTLPEYYGRVACFTFEGTTRYDGEAGYKNQRQFHAHLELRVDAVFLIRGKLLTPHAFVRVDEDIE
jgi:hypothetical protein